MENYRRQIFGRADTKIQKPIIIKEFKISDLITLKLENDKINIYVNGKLFNQCKYLLINIGVNEVEDYDEIESIDEAVEVYNYNKDHETHKVEIDPETEFMGHCSNLQAWVENNYNLGLLHSSLSFPLLARLVKEGDKKAEITLKEEVLERINSNSEKVITYFVNEKYLDLFTYEELQTIFDKVIITNQQLLQRLNDLMNKKYLIEKLKKRGHIKIEIERI